MQIAIDSYLGKCKILLLKVVPGLHGELPFFGYIYITDNPEGLDDGVLD